MEGLWKERKLKKNEKVTILAFNDNTTIIEEYIDYSKPFQLIADKIRSINLSYSNLAAALDIT